MKGKQIDAHASLQPTSMTKTTKDTSAKSTDKDSYLTNV
jgi:hypothetical protein